mmetsp:Transcript_13030/g.40140  ORF Transcript_13030/g.40140 Transcript_13030/m.40140 type:complete len:226 (-) Transcript_13030:757-1434(-)
MAIGAASPRAHGQATITTLTASRSANAFPMEDAILARAGILVQAKKVKNEAAITNQQNFPATASAIRSVGVFDACIKATIRWTSDINDSEPTFATLHVTPLVPTCRLPESTSSPSLTTTGAFSPVTTAVFTSVVPSITTQSTGNLSPGTTTIWSPAFRFSVKTFEPLARVATRGCKAARSCICREACFLSDASIILPPATTANRMICSWKDGVNAPVTRPYSPAP